MLLYICRWCTCIIFLGTEFSLNLKICFLEMKECLCLHPRKLIEARGWPHHNSDTDVKPLTLPEVLFLITHPKKFTHRFCFLNYISFIFYEIFFMYKLSIVLLTDSKIFNNLNFYLYLIHRQKILLFWLLTVMWTLNPMRYDFWLTDWKRTKKLVLLVVASTQLAQVTITNKFTGSTIAFLYI